MTALPAITNLPTLSQEGGLAGYLAAIRKFPMLTAEEEAIYARRWREAGDREAAYYLVTAHLRLAAKIALNHRGYGLPLADLISEANLGLMQAVKRFEPDKGFRLSTYAVWWIKATVQEYVLRAWSLVKIGTTPAQKKLFFNLRRLRRKIACAGNDVLSPDQVGQIADELKVTPKGVVEMDARLRGDVSLNAPVDLRDADEDLLDRLADPCPDPERLLTEADDLAHLRASLRSALATLTARERGIIEQRYLRERPATLDELGRSFAVSRERIRQIEQRALQKLKTAVSARRGLAQPSEGRRSRLRRRGTTHSEAMQAMAMAA